MPFHFTDRSCYATSITAIKFWLPPPPSCILTPAHSDGCVPRMNDYYNHRTCPSVRSRVQTTCSRIIQLPACTTVTIHDGTCRDRVPPSERSPCRVEVLCYIQPRRRKQLHAVRHNQHIAVINVTVSHALLLYDIILCTRTWTTTSHTATTAVTVASARGTEHNNIGLGRISPATGGALVIYHTVTS